MTTAAVLPHVNAALNALSTVLLIAGFLLIRSGRRAVHRKVMIAALGVSAVFLASYLVYHFTAPIFVFPGTGWTRPFYYALLVSHVVLATIVAPMVAVTVWRALKGSFDRHKAIARWTIGAWLYVTVTGVAIYLILYHVYPPAQPSSLARSAEDPGVSRFWSTAGEPNTSGSSRPNGRKDDTGDVA